MLSEKFQDIFSQLEIDPAEVQEDMLLEDGLGMDSQEIIELQSAIEKTLGIKLPAGFIDREMTVGGLIEKVDAVVKE